MTGLTSPLGFNDIRKWNEQYVHLMGLDDIDAEVCRRATVATPINVILLSLFVILAYYRLRPAPPTTLPRAPEPVVFRTFTPRILQKYNGENGQPVYLAVKTKVYDVSPGRNFYGPGGPYENFAGRDATRGLACQSFDDEMLTKDLDGPLDDCSDLTAEQIENLSGWIERFDEKVRKICR